MLNLQSTVCYSTVVLATRLFSAAFIFSQKKHIVTFDFSDFRCYLPCSRQFSIFRIVTISILIILLHTLKSQA